MGWAEQSPVRYRVSDKGLFRPFGTGSCEAAGSCIRMGQGDTGSVWDC